MMWSVKHKSGRVLFVTSDEFIADNRKKMGWIVEEVKVTSREQFEKFVVAVAGGVSLQTFIVHDGIYYKDSRIQGMWRAWQASRSAVEIESPEFIDSRSALDKGYMVDYSNGFGDAMDAYELAIEQAGLKVKK